MKKKISLRNVILVLVPVLAAAGALAAFSLLPKDDQLLLEGSVEIASTTCFAQAGGRVESVLVQPGQRVEAGELLAVLDDSPVDDQIALLKQTQAIKEAQLQQLSAPLNLDSQQAARRAAQANVDLTRLQLDQLEPGGLSDPGGGGRGGHQRGPGGRLHRGRRPGGIQAVQREPPVRRVLSAPGLSAPGGVRG